MVVVDVLFFMEIVEIVGLIGIWLFVLLICLLGVVL